MHNPIFQSALSLILLLLFTFTNLTTARPLFPAVVNWLHSSSPSMPSSALPAPTGTLKYVALGLGTQNYTCTSSSAIPVSLGAVAKLYDATETMSLTGWIAQTATQQMPCFADKSDTSFGLRQIGVHYFNGLGVPNFDLSMSGSGDYLSAAKIANVTAPAGSCNGRSGDPAVAWLYLTQDGTGRSVGLSSVYRVETAGGTATTCEGVVDGWVTRDYSAEYWFYE